MNKLLIALLVLGFSSAAHAETSVDLNGTEARLMAKILKLVGVSGDLVVDEDGIQYHLRKTDCTMTRISADGLPSFQCASTADSSLFTDELAAGALYAALAESGLDVQGDTAAGGKIHVENATCTVYMGGSTYCEISTQSYHYDDYDYEGEGDGEGARHSVTRH